MRGVGAALRLNFKAAHLEVSEDGFVFWIGGKQQVLAEVARSTYGLATEKKYENSCKEAAPAVTIVLPLNCSYAPPVCLSSFRLGTTCKLLKQRTSLQEHQTTRCS